jgi:hypothetical protein
MGLPKNIAKLGNNLKGVIQSIIDPKQMRELAIESGFVKRFSSRLSGDEFIQLLLIESADGAKNTLRGSIDTLGLIKSEAKMSIQALGKRINTLAAATFVEGIFEKALQVVINQINCLKKPSKKELKLLSFFTNVYIQDSSECQLDPLLKDDYKGSGGGSGNGKGDASVKIDLIYEYKKKCLSEFKVTDRGEPDVVLGERILEIIKAGDLVLRDLGYSNIELFKRIQELGAFFLSRLHASVHVYLNATDTQPLSLGDFLEKKINKSGMIDIQVYLGKPKFGCRLVAYRAPPEIVKERREAYLKECKKRKRTPNEEYLKKLAFTIYITNVPVTMWPAKLIGTIYRLRWQIELIFKAWKSNLNFDFLKGTNVYRIRCLIYGRLTAILMLFTIYSCIDSVALEQMDKEISVHKVIDWITKNGRYFRVVMDGFCKKLWISLIEASKHLLCKDKRKGRKTTRELIDQLVSFGCVKC